MLAGDLSPTRLEQARRKLLDLLRTRNDAQTAIVVYAGSAHPGAAVGRPAHRAQPARRPETFDHARARPARRPRRAPGPRPAGTGRPGPRPLLLTSGLSEPERQGIRSALEHRAARLAVLGVGTPKGAPVQQEDGSFLKDDQGGILLPRLDESGCAASPRRSAPVTSACGRTTATSTASACWPAAARWRKTARTPCCACSAGPTRVTGCSCRCSCWPPVPDGAAGCSCRC